MISKPFHERSHDDDGPNAGSRCFMCGSPVQHPAVRPDADPGLWVHPRCALRAARDIANDPKTTDDLLGVGRGLVADVLALEHAR